VAPQIYTSITVLYEVLHNGKYYAL
jgi:hypothetical protein